MNPKTKEDFDLLYHTLESELYSSCALATYIVTNIPNRTVGIVGKIYEA